MTIKQQGQAAGLFGAVALLSALFCWFFIAGRFSHPAVWIQLALGVAALAAYLVTNLDSLGTQLGGRGTFYGVVSAATAAIVLAALAGLNYIAVKKPKTWDLTKEKLYTLSDQTDGVLKGLKSEVRVVAFYAPNEPEFSELDQRLRQYRQRTDKLKVEMLDPTKHVKEVKEFNISQGGPRVIVKAGGKESRAKDVSEESLTNAIAEVTRGASKKIYFSKGHGERAISDATERGMKLWVDGLKSEGYQIGEIELAANKTMPADAQALVIAGPVAALNEGEAKLVQEWVDKGGKVIALVDPGVHSGLEKAFTSWGVKVGDDEVIDTESQQPEVAIAQEYADHPITNPRSSPFQVACIFPLARSVSKAKDVPAGWSVTELARTGARAWGETDPIRDGRVEYTPGKDLMGPVPLAIAASHGSGDSEGRVVVIGNSSFAANGFYQLRGNRDFALNAASWVAHEEAKISIRPRTRSGNALFLTAAQKNTMTLFAFDLLPFSLLFAGLLVWQTRKAR
ncbi:MAG TPA: GldG family protein [Myxococcales bacterium]|nr:GldG family protein [Myxococcales bacterium]